MSRLGTILVFAMAGAAVAAQGRGRSMKELTLLTREGCVNTPDMTLNLDDALLKLGWRRDYEEIDIGKLPKGDVRTGYPTPTVLWKDHDLFGLPVPKPPLPSPT